jgi:hypothetical protein
MPCTAQRVLDHQLDRPDVHAQRDRAGAFLGPGASELHDPLPVNLDHVKIAEFMLQHLERGALGATGRLADFLHVADMEVDEFTEGLEFTDARYCRCLAAINLSFGVNGPTLSIFVADKILADGATFASDLDAPGASFLFADRGHFRGANPVR